MALTKPAIHSRYAQAKCDAFRVVRAERYRTALHARAPLKRTLCVMHEQKRERDRAPVKELPSRKINTNTPSHVAAPSIIVYIASDLTLRSRQTPAQSLGEERVGWRRAAVTGPRRGPAAASMRIHRDAERDAT